MALSVKQRKENAERVARVLELRARGVKPQQIVDMKIPGVGSLAQVSRITKRGLDMAPKLAAEQLREVENMKLDNLEQRLNTIIYKKDTEDKSVIAAANAVINAMKRRADLNGIDLRATDAPGGGVQTVLVDTSILLKSRRAPGEEVETDDDGE